MGAQNVRRAIVTIRAVGVEGVHLGPRRVVDGDVQSVEVVPVAFDLRPFGDAKAHVGENGSNFLGHLADGVDGSLTTPA